MVAFCRAVLPACTITQYEWAGILHERQDYHPRMSGRYSAPDKESEIFEFLNFEVTTTLLYPRIYKSVKKMVWNGFLKIDIFPYMANTEAIHVQCRFWGNYQMLSKNGNILGLVRC